MITEDLKEIFHSNPLFQGGFLLGVLTAIGAIFKNVPKNIYKFIHKNIIYTVNIPQTDNMFRYLNEYMKEYHNKKFNIVETDTNNYRLSYTQLTDVFYIRHKNRFIKFNKAKNKLDHASTTWDMFYKEYTLSSIYGKRIINDFLLEVIDYNKKVRIESTGVSVFAYSKGNGNFEYQTDREIKPLSMIPLKDKDKLIKNIDDWIANEKWYVDRSIPYKRGILFYGEPGNGKTTTAISIAKQYNKSLFVITLNGLNDDDIKKAFSKLSNDSLVLIEDVDCAYNEREVNTKSNVNFSFSTLLNCIDGAFSATKIITIFTTNHFEKLDPALIRTGRADLKFEITNPDDIYIQEYINLFYNSKINYNLNCYNLLSMSDIQNHCLENISDYNKAIAAIQSHVKRISIKENKKVEELSI